MKTKWMFIVVGAVALMSACAGVDTLNSDVLPKGPLSPTATQQLLLGTSLLGTSEYSNVYLADDVRKTNPLVIRGYYSNSDYRVDGGVALNFGEIVIPLIGRSPNVGVYDMQSLPMLHSMFLQESWSSVNGQLHIDEIEFKPVGNCDTSRDIVGHIRGSIDVDGVISRTVRSVNPASFTTTLIPVNVHGDFMASIHECSGITVD